MLAALTLLLASWWLAPAPPVLMHSPHDVIEGFAISPNYGHDRTLFLALSRFNLLLRSRDGGQSFEPVGGGLDNSHVKWLSISTDYPRDRTLWCAEERGLFVTRDRGDFWLRVDTPTAMREPLGVASSPDYANDGTLAAGTRHDGLWMSRDRGATWSLALLPGKAKPGRAGPLHPVAFSQNFAQDGELVAIVNGSRIARSADGGQTFTEVAGPGPVIQSMVLAENFGQSGALWVGTRDAGVWRSNDKGETWRAEGEGTAGMNVLHLTRVRGKEGGVMFASTAAEGVLIRKDGGDWTTSNTGFREQTHQSTLHYLGTMPSPAFGADQTVFVATFEGLHVSRTGGESWQWLNVLHPNIVRNMALSEKFAVDKRLWLSTYGAGLQFSADGGETFRMLSTGAWMFPDGIAVSPNFGIDRTLLVGAPNRLMLSVDAGKTVLTALPGGLGFPRFLAFAPDYAQSGIAFAFFMHEQVSKNRFTRTANRCAQWTDCKPKDVVDMAFASDWRRSGRVFAASTTGLLRSDDKGVTFNRVEALDALGVSSVALAPGPKGDILMVTSWAAGVHLSRDGGESWVLLALGMPPVRPSRVRLSPGFAHDGVAFAGPANDTLYVTRNSGRTWSRVTNGPRMVMSLEISPTFEADHTLLVGSYEAPWISRDAGATWTRLKFAVPTVPAMSMEKPAAAGGALEEVPGGAAQSSAEQPPPR